MVSIIVKASGVMAWRREVMGEWVAKPSSYLNAMSNAGLLRNGRTGETIAALTKRAET
jgi:cytochrome c2